ncbi:MAG TPA: MmgE/PrpD family protein [Gammaproteobacteria bacterium]|nr:MmgE/PrpD family protein [Gammaproteobacteria bacterium]
MAQALVAYSPGDVAPEVAAKAKLCVLDLLSSAFAARDLPWAAQAAELARQSSLGVAKGAGILGSSDIVSIQDAAFANGVIGHGLVRDDMHVGSVSHLGTVLVPTVLALAEGARASGAELLAALVAGYEVGGKVGRMLMDSDVTKIFRPTGTVGPIAAAAAGAKLLGLDENQTVTALALGANAAAGYNEWAATGGSEMFFHTGFAARSGVAAAQLAAGGAYASRTAIDGEAGLLAAFHRDLAPQIPMLFADRAEILSVFFKPVPACNFAQSAAQAAHTIAQRKKLRANDIERVTVRVTRAAALYPGCDVSGPFEHVLQAKMSIHYNVAAALRHGDFDESNYVPQQNSDVLTIATKTRLEVDDELTKAFPAKQGAEVVVQTRAGDELRERVEDVVPTDEAGVRARFAAAAAAVLGERQAARLVELVDGLESHADAAALSRATRPSARAATPATRKRLPRAKRVTPAKRPAAPKRAAKSKRAPRAKRAAAGGRARRKASR